MNDSDIRDKSQPSRPDPWDGEAHSDRTDIRTPVAGFTCAAQWGLASLLIGCTLLVAACVLLVFNVLLFRGGPAGIPTGLALVGGLIGSLAVSILGLASLLFGIWGWRHAHVVGESPALGVAGVIASFAGLVAWLIAAIDLMMILFSFNR
jgi:drug/metabolite transporter (DMT)-like permease